MSTLTPLMSQYNDVKKRFQDCLVLFHLGDFYELFNEDAEHVSKILGLTLTKRGENPMCGIPCSTLDFYIKKLVKITKKKIAICNQINTPDEARAIGEKLVTRDVTKIITRGTYHDMFSEENNFILAIVPKKTVFNLCFADFSSGECFTIEVEPNCLFSEIYKINPSEILLEKDLPELSVFEDLITIFSPAIKQEENRAFDMVKLYAKNNKIDLILNLTILNDKNFMRFSQNTIKNLEILQDSTGEEKHSLFGALNRTKTPEGRRLLRQALVRPLVNRNLIEKKLDCVEFFQAFISKQYPIKFPPGDLTRLVNALDHPKKLRQIGEIIREGLNLTKDLNKEQPLPEFLKNLEVHDLMIYEQILKNMAENPGEIGDGSCFKSSDEMKILNSKKTRVLNDIFGLPDKYKLNCRIKNNSLIGYFFEFTKTQAPTDWILKQGLATSNRYTNQELTSLEVELKEIEEQLLHLDKKLFNELKSQVWEKKSSIENFAHFLGYLDYFQSCAINAIEHNYFRPTFSDQPILEIENGRHPVLEKLQTIFIPNDLQLNSQKTELLITGPNMGGKSTFLRQNALLILMAQAGMFVPAKMLTKIFDGIFVRMGSADHISQKESTFMVEMKECAEILNLATENSFIILDEVGRGTSTNDGMSICFGILEFIHDHLRCFALISTHYNELSKCADYLSRFQNYKIDIFFDEQIITFLYKVIPGIAESSFGIFVASLANLPKQVVERSKEIFKQLKN